MWLTMSYAPVSHYVNRKSSFTHKITTSMNMLFKNMSRSMTRALLKTAIRLMDVSLLTLYCSARMFSTHGNVITLMLNKLGL